MKSISVAIDIGYSNVKIASGSAPLPKICIYPAGVGPVNAFGEDIGLADSLGGSGEVIDVFGSRYIALVDQSSLRNKRTRHSGYPLTDEYLALCLAALRKQKMDEVDLLVTGVPVKQYFDRSFCVRLAERLKGDHKIHHGQSITINEVIVKAQPMGSYADASIQLASPSDRQIVRCGRVLVLDPGSQTLDWAAFDQGRLIQSASGSSYLAMGQVLELASKHIETELGDRVKPERIEQALRDGLDTVLFHGEHLDYSRFINSALQSLHRDIVTELLNTKTLEREQFDLMIVTGGGAHYYREIANQAFSGSRIEILPHPVAANVRGYWLLAMARHQSLAAIHSAS